MSALVLFFSSDALNKILLYHGAEFNRISIIIRAFYELVFIGIIILFVNKARSQFIFLFLAWFAVFLLGQFILFLRVEYTYNFIENINIFNKYLFVLIIYFALYRYQYFAEKFSRLLKVLEFLFLVNAFLIFIGFIFQMDVFSTYVKNNAFTYRFGYSGLIPAQNEATMFLFISISYFYYKFFIRKEDRGKWKFYCVLLSSFLLGTKGIYLFLVMFFIFHAIINSTAKQKKIAGIVILVSIAAGFILFQSDLSNVLFGYYKYNLEKKGFLFTLLSGRNTFIELKFMQILSFWTPVNFFIGGQDQTRYLMEMDFFDAFLFFGLVGLVIFLILYFKTLFRFGIRKPFFLFFVFSFFLISFFTGHFFTSAVNALYLALVCMYFYISKTENPSLVEKSELAS